MDQIRLPKQTVDAIERRWISRFGPLAAKPIDRTDVQLARVRAHRSNIRRYRRLLETKLTDVERRFIERRLEEERLALDDLVRSGIAIRPSIAPMPASSANLLPRECGHE